MFWTYILTVWTHTLGFWTYILCFELIFCVLNLYFGCLNLYVGCLGRIGSAGSAGLGGRPGRVSSTFGGKIHFGNLYPKKSKYWLYFWILNLLYKKKRALKNAAFSRYYRAEICHMRPIQGRKLKLIIWVVSQFNFWKEPLYMSRKSVHFLKRAPII